MDKLQQYLQSPMHQAVSAVTDVIQSELKALKVPPLDCFACNIRFSPRDALTEVVIREKVREWWKGYQHRPRAPRLSPEAEADFVRLAMKDIEERTKAAIQAVLGGQVPSQLNPINEDHDKLANEVCGWMIDELNRLGVAEEDIYGCWVQIGPGMPTPESVARSVRAWNGRRLTIGKPDPAPKEPDIGCMILKLSRRCTFCDGKGEVDSPLHVGEMVECPNCEGTGAMP